jgi:hypothetical protein
MRETIVLANPSSLVDFNRRQPNDFHRGVGTKAFENSSVCWSQVPRAHVICNGILAAWSPLAGNITVCVERRRNLNTTVESDSLGRRDARRIVRDAEHQRRSATDSAAVSPSRQAFKASRCNSFVWSHLTNKCDDYPSKPDDASCRKFGVVRLVRRALEPRVSIVVLSTKPLLSEVAWRHGELSTKCSAERFVILVAAFQSNFQDRSPTNAKLDGSPFEA